MFAEGDMAVYPAHGVGVIKSIEMQTVAGIDQSFYVLEILENRMTIMIPTISSESVGLRAIVNESEVSGVLDILEDRTVVLGTQTWNRRYRDYMEKIKTGSVHEVAAVLRDLFLLSVDKDLSYGERKMLDTAKGLLVYNKDVPGVIGALGTTLGDAGVNISRMTVGREEESNQNVILLSTDELTSKELLEKVLNLKNVADAQILDLPRL